MYSLKSTLQEIVVQVIDIDLLPQIILREIEVEEDFPNLQHLGVSPDNFSYLQ